MEARGADWKISQDFGHCEGDIILAEAQHPGPPGCSSFKPCFGPSPPHPQPHLLGLGSMRGERVP